MNSAQFLQTLRPALPMSVEKPCTPMSNGELKRHIEQGGVLLNGERVSLTEEINFPVFSIVFFPRGNRKTTIL
jgi:hypothetical protein